MTWSNAFIAIVTVLYAGVAVAALAEGNKAKAVVFAGYTLANVGFMLLETR